jgi:hypothetical protein
MSEKITAVKTLLNNPIEEKRDEINALALEISNQASETLGARVEVVCLFVMDNSPTCTWCSAAGTLDRKSSNDVMGAFHAAEMANYKQHQH